MSRLTSPIENLQDHYPVLVVGSGYGGAIAAARLARAGQRVAVLERGREWQPGEYPSTEPEVTREMQADVADGAGLPSRHVGSASGLYEFNLGPDLNVFKGCGLGGTSLVNAGVALRADPRVFDDLRWPEGLRRDVGTLLEEGYGRAEAMLKPAPYPDHFPTPAKLLALEKSARFMRAVARRPPINVNFTLDGPNHVGVEQRPCSLCGDCVTGCNYAAKNTLIMNYLPEARTAGAEIFTEVDVRSIERRAGGQGWLVHCRLLGLGREKFHAPEFTLSAELVILGAGSLGSTEILLRSRDRGLALSARVGEGLTGNGDMLAFAYDGADEVNGVGWGSHPKGEIPPVGPCITGMIDLRHQATLDDGLVIEEGSPPGALGRFLPEALALLGPRGQGSGSREAEGREQKAGSIRDQPSPWGEGGPQGPGEGIGEAESTRQKPESRMPNPDHQELASLFDGPYCGAVRNTQTFLAMGHDDGAGRMTLEHDQLSIHWPGAGGQPVFQRIRERLAEATRALEGNLVMNPLWTKLLRHNLLTVHPLGGCAMAERAEDGVVNHKGQVFSGASGAAVYENLYVCDGAIIPRPLGVNPLLTISALAERCCALAALDHGWNSGVRAQGSAAKGPRGSAASLCGKAQPFRTADGRGAALQRADRATVGLEFTETMRGYFSRRVTDDFGRGATQGKLEGSSFAFTLSIISEDLDEMLASPAHPARMIGSVTAPALSPHPLAVTDGIFNLFPADPDAMGARHMRYRMKLTASDGDDSREYYFEGFKVICAGRAGHLWHDTTTLYITLYGGPPPAVIPAQAGIQITPAPRRGNPESPVLGKGILKISPADFMRQLTTLRVTGARGLAERLDTEARFGRFLAGVLYRTYGGVLARATGFDAAPPRKEGKIQSPRA